MREAFVEITTCTIASHGSDINYNKTVVDGDFAEMLFLKEIHASLQIFCYGQNDVMFNDD